MAKQRKFTDSEKAEALVALRANNSNVAKTAKLLGIPRKTLSAWSHDRGTKGVTSEMLEEKASSLADKFQKIAEVLTDHLTDPDKIAKDNLQQVATSAAIATDKMNLLRSLPTSISQRIDTGTKATYERSIAQLLQQSKSSGVDISREEAIDLLSVHFADIREVIH